MLISSRSCAVNRSLAPVLQFWLPLQLMIFSGPGFAQAQGALSVKDLKQDVSALRTALERHHPGLYWYTSNEEFNSCFVFHFQILQRLDFHLRKFTSSL